MTRVMVQPVGRADATIWRFQSALKPIGALLVLYCAGRREVGTGRYEGAKAEMADAVPATLLKARANLFSP
jgi:hypothetical protein